MGNRSRQRLHNQQQHMNRPTFLPILCSKTSIKDVAIPKWEEEDRSDSFSDEPLSPKVGCMGQVKRNNRVVGLPTPYKVPSINKTTANIKYSKLKKLFSSKNLLGSAAATPSPTHAAACAAARGQSNGCAKPRRGRVPESGINPGGQVVDIKEMDPPLPVVKKVRKPEEEGEGDQNLWKRRLGGVAALKSLELQQIHHPRHHLQPVTV